MDVCQQNNSQKDFLKNGEAIYKNLAVKNHKAFSYSEKKHMLQFANVRKMLSDGHCAQVITLKLSPLYNKK